MTNDDMVSQTDIQQFPAVLQPFRQFHITFAGNRVSRRVVVNKYNLDGADERRAQKDFPWADKACAYGSFG